MNTSNGAPSIPRIDAASSFARVLGASSYARALGASSYARAPGGSSYARAPGGSSFPRMRESSVLILFLLMLASSGSAHAQLDGTLFTQPEERAYLDYLRDEFLRNNAEQGFDIQEAEVPVVPGDEAAEPAGPTEFSFGGIMTRRDGSRSLWLNGALLAESALPAGMSLVSDGRSTALRITHEGTVYVLRPGQTVDLVTGSVMEGYQRPQATPVTDVDATQHDADVADTSAPATAGVTEETDASALTPATGIAGTLEALTSAVDTLDDSQVAALVEALQTLRPARAADAEEDEADEAADDDEP